MLSYIFLVELFFSCWVIFSHWLFHEAALCFMFQVRHLIFFLWHSLYCTVLMWILWSKELNFLHFCHVIFGDFSMQKSHKYIHIIHLTAVAWVSGPNLAPQKMKLCQKFRHLMRCKKYFEFFFILLSFWDTAVCLHFWAKFKMAARDPKRVTSQVFWSFLLPKKFPAPYSS